jgi:hypothetical protein
MEGAPTEHWKSIGAVASAADSRLSLEVDADRVVAVCQEILAGGGVEDFTVEEVPLEDIIHRLFSAQS